MYLGYNTNGWAHHDLFDAVALLAEIGYRGVAITIDHGVLSPRDDRWPDQLAQLKDTLDRLGLRSVIETGARYLLDPRQKHEPTLVSSAADARARRVAFYRHAIACAAELKSDCVSIWSGTVHDDAPAERAMDRLAAGLEETVRYAAARGVPIAFEPEPGMLVDSMAAFERLLQHVDHENLRLTLDIGHLECQGEVPLARQVRRWADRLANIHLEDARRGVHEHLMFGQGRIDFPPVFQALGQIGYTGGVYVELSRHGHVAPLAARQAYEFLRLLATHSDAPHA